MILSNELMIFSSWHCSNDVVYARRRCVDNAVQGLTGRMYMLISLIPSSTLLTCR